MVVVLIVAVWCFLTGCATAGETYVRADRSTFKAIAPEYLRYVQDDPGLTETDKQLRIGTLTLWDERILAEERRQKLLAVDYIHHSLEETP